MNELKKITLAAILALVAPAAWGQLSLELGDDSTGATQTADSAFDNWTTGANNDLADLTVSSGTFTGNGYLMDTGESAGAPFGLAPAASGAPNAPFTRNGIGAASGFSYTVYNTPLSDTTQATWNTPPATLGDAIEGYPVAPATISAGLTSAHQAGDFNIEDPVSQGGGNATVNGVDLFGYDGQDSGNVNGSNRRDGFTIEMSVPINDLGIFLADFESATGGSNFEGLVAIYDASGNLIDSDTMDFGTNVDGSNGFAGLTSTTAFSYASFWVGSDSGTNPTAFAYGFGGFTFAANQIPEPSVVIGGAMAVLLVGVVLYRRRKLASSK